MPNLFTWDQTVALALEAGFTPYNSRIMAAICMCEAPGGTRDGKPLADFNAIGDQDLANEVWGYSYGGAQIRSLRADAGTGRTRDAERLHDPLFNLRSARRIKLDAGSFKPWSTFTSGMFKAYLQTKSPDGIGPVFPPPVGTYVVVAGDTLSGIAKKHGNVWDWQELARVNGLHLPYLIRIGDELTLPTTTGG